MRTAEQLAKITLEKFKNSSGYLSYPIDPFKMLKDENIEFLLIDFDKIDGIITRDDEGKTIVGINYNNGWQRQRFTAAHEYCHFIKDLDNETGTTNVIQCLKKSNSAIEKYANDFAGYLLMPTDELKKICLEYRNTEGYIDFESITIIAEYFGVSFQSCINRIAYGLHMIKGDISSTSLKKRIKEYNPTNKRKELIENGIDRQLLSNIVSSMSYIMIDLNHFTGQKFLQRYVYNDNKLEGVNIERGKLNYILADLNYNGINSKFFDSTKEEIVMTLGNYELQKYVITTNDSVSFKKCKSLHSLLFNYVPFPDDNGQYRNESAIIKGGTIQPIPYYQIKDEIEKLDAELQYFNKNSENYTIGEYIEQIAYLTYKFIVIHPFRDGNGRISRAFLNWLLSKRNIPPIYIDKTCRDEYYKSLSVFDVNENPVPFIMFIEKRIIHTMIVLHQNLFVDDIDEENTED